MLESWIEDVRYALRRLRSRRTYAVLTVLTLSLGVGGTAAVCAIARRLLLEPLPVRNEAEVATFWAPFGWSEAEFLHLRPGMGDFRAVAMYRPQDVTFQSAGEPARLAEGIAASAELFQVLGASPALGSGFRPGDDRTGAEPVAVLSHALWRELGGDPMIVGRRVVLDGAPRTVVGVMPEGFWFPSPSTRVWLSAPLDPENQSGNYMMLARLRAGASVASMDGQLRRMTALLGERFDYPPEWDKTRAPSLTPLRESLVGPVRPAVLAMLAGMSVLLLIACVNVAALMLGQMDSRGPELAVRAALGAGRRRLLQQLVAESLVIGTLAGVVGAGLAFLCFRFLAGALPLGALADTARMDWTLFAAALVIALAAATVVALVPGVSIGRGNLQAWLTRVRTGGVAGRGRGGRLESGLVVAQVALVLLMAAGAGLLIRSVGNLRAIDPGIDPGGVAVIDVLMPDGSDAERRPQTLREMVDAVGRLPGVASAAAVQKLPLRGRGDSWGIRIESQPDRERSTTYFRMVSPDYFQAMGIPLRSGRGFRETDRATGGDGVIVINQALADEYFPGVDPLGQRIALGDAWNRVIGVVGNVAEADLTGDPQPARYMLYEQVGWPGPQHSIVMRMRGGGDPAAVLNAARQAIQGAAPGVAVRRLTTMDAVFTEAIGPARQVMALLALLGALAMALGTIGVYGVVSHFVIRRRRDWAIRLALGMRPAEVVRQVIGRSGALVAAGIVLGLAGFLALARLLASFLYGVGAADPPALAGATAVLMGAGLLAAWLPARRASRIDPAGVLREQ
jgi:putative ABC transport system permease protein